MAEQKKVVGTKEAARRLGVSVRTVQLWVEDGVLEAWKTPGGHRRVLESSLDRLLAEPGRPRRHAASVKSSLSSASGVLIVEDDLTMQSYYQALFQILAPNVALQFAGNGFEGLVALGELHPALAIVDVDMPGMDGVELINSIASSELCAATKMVVITGLDQDQVRQRGALPSDVPVFSKPINVDDLRALLAQYLPGESQS